MARHEERPPSGSPMEDFDRANARRAAARLRALVAAQGPPVSPEEAERNWEQLKCDLEIE